MSSDPANRLLKNRLRNRSICLSYVYDRGREGGEGGGLETTVSQIVNLRHYLKDCLNYYNMRFRTKQVLKLNCSRSPYYRRTALNQVAAGI